MKHSQPRQLHKSGEMIYRYEVSFRILESYGLWSYGGDIREVNSKQTKKSFLVVP